MSAVVAETYGLRDASFAEGWSAERLCALLAAIGTAIPSLRRALLAGDVIHVTARHRPSPSHKRDRAADASLSWHGDDEARDWRAALTALGKASGLCGHRIGAVWGIRQSLLPGFPPTESARNRRTPVEVKVSAPMTGSATLDAARVARALTPDAIRARQALLKEAAAIVAATDNRDAGLHRRLLESIERARVAAH